MSSKIKNILVTIIFVTILIVVFIANIIEKDEKISLSERRTLTQFPKITVEKLFNGEVSEQFEKYTADQFILRDFFRGIKSFWNINIYKQQDDNKMFVKDDGLYKMEYPLNEKNVKNSASKIKAVYDNYLKEMNVYYAIIPDKNYYLENDSHLKMDYKRLKEIMSEELKDLDYIDIWNELKIEDYYKTDLHWKQENIRPVVQKIEKEMGLKDSSNVEYAEKEVGDFFGTYYGQIASNVEPDKLYILTNDKIEKCTTYNYEKQKEKKVYDENKTDDKYDIYLSGATPLIEINNPNANSEKELLLFRDSFGSSLAPLLIENYKKITLIDLRYMSSKLLEQYIEFENQDVLFMYSSLILNQNILK